MLTLEEQERRAYVAGDTALVTALHGQMDYDSERVLELEHEVRQLKQEVQDLESVIDDLKQEI